MSLLLIFVPAHRAFSLDSRLRPTLRSDTAPAWTLWMLRAQIGIVYFFGGVAKLNGDWLQGEPMRMWLTERTDFPLIGALGIYFAWQLLMPLRHFVYPGDVNWTEEGHTFSWHMRLSDKQGYARFHVTDTAWEVDPLEYLTERQFEQMATQPDMLLQFSHFLADELRRQGHEQIEVHVLAQASLNGRRAQQLIDHIADLAAQPRTLLPASWIAPLVEPLLEICAYGID
jgi:hypothetical protein